MKASGNGGMPRRKKNGQSPARVPGGPGERGSLGLSAGHPLPPGYEGAMANNLSTGDSLSSSTKENMVKNMQEMFSQLDPEVIYIVLSECEFKVEDAMDSLVELSAAAEVAAPIPPLVSGFERTAAALLSPTHFPRPGPNSHSSSVPSQQPSSSSPSTNLLTDELDLLVDQELETLSAMRNLKDVHNSSQYFSAGASLSSFPAPPLPQQPLPELLLSSLKPRSRVPSSEKPYAAEGSVVHMSTSSPLDQLSSMDDQNAERQHCVMDFTNVGTKMPAGKPKPPLDLAASGRPSAFQAYKKQDAPSHAFLATAGVTPSDEIVGGARSKVNMLNREPLGYVPSPWNLEAPAFSPHIHGNHGPSFITPVVQTPSNWPHQTRLASSWLSHTPVSQAPLKPSATIPNSWALPTAAPQLPSRHNRLRLDGKLLVMLRGGPGSGKSTLGRALLEHNPDGVILSTDDYFNRRGEYQFDPTALGQAHEWNHKRAKDAFESGSNPIIIDNTNMQGWEMKPYVAQALKHGYKVLFREPDTWWKNKPRELVRRTSHNVPVETVRRMLNGYERFVTVQSIMGSNMPEWKQRPPENKSEQLAFSVTPCPDLVREPGLTKGCMKSRSQLFSSLPDVSSIGRSSEVGQLEDGTHRSTESLDFQPNVRSTEKPGISGGEDDLDLEDLDPESEAQLKLKNSAASQMIPDCIVESVMNDDQRGDDIPVAFSVSIGQRVKRERTSRRSGFDRTDSADLVECANRSESEAKEKERTREEAAGGVEIVRDEEERPEILDFVGDWPSGGSLDQRQMRKRERPEGNNGKENEGAPQEGMENKVKAKPGPDLTEFQKVIDIIQTGTCAIETPSPSHSASMSSEEALLNEMEAGDRSEESPSSESTIEEKEDDVTGADSRRGELPDCVLGWKTPRSCRLLKTRTDDGEELQVEMEATTTTAANDRAPAGPNPLSDITADSLFFSQIAAANVCHVAEGSHSDGGNVGTEPGDTSTNGRTGNGSEADDSHISEGCQSPMCEGPVEAEGSQERKQRQGRRSGKQCKLALTFTRNCPVPSLHAPEFLNSTARNTDCPQNSISSVVEASFYPSIDSTLYLETSIDLYTDFKAEEPLKPLPGPVSPVDTGCSTQTEPQDFAFLWRLNHQNSQHGDIRAACGPSGDFAVLHGESYRFASEPSSAVFAAVAVRPSGHRDTLYRVVHEKGTQVEEKELGGTQGRLECLCILSRHFKLVSFDTLEDLFDKCHQDLEWTTNLLLDSGEKFFKDEDGKEDDSGAPREDDGNTADLCGTVGEVIETSSYPHVSDEAHSEYSSKGSSDGVEEGTERSTTGTAGESPSHEGVAASVRDEDATSGSDKAPPTDLGPCKPTRETDDAEVQGISEPDMEGGAWGGGLEDGVIIEDLRTVIEDEIASMDEVHRLLEEMQREEDMNQRRSRHLDIQSVELKLPTELALQLTELYGPVGVDPGTCSSDDFAVQMDLKLAKLLHQKWKETIQERQRRETLSFHLLQESSARLGESQGAKPGPQDVDGYPSDVHGQLPFMDHWNVRRPNVSLRNIMQEEQALQKNVEKTRQSRADLDQRDGAVLLKESKLYALFPNIDRHFLLDIFRDHNYSLTQTEQFLRPLLDEEPVKTVVAPEAPRTDHHRAASKEREKRQKTQELTVPNYQDAEDPEYGDFRVEANLQRTRQLESFAKAAEAFKQGRKEVASFYAQQGHMHGQRMREANHRAAAQIFERVNASLLPQNILDLHGLHVDEALQHLAQVLQDKTTECERSLCRPQLSVITGRGNHSQGGVARIRPAVIDYLTNKHYRFTEPKPGLMLVSLK